MNETEWLLVLEHRMAEAGLEIIERTSPEPGSVSYRLRQDGNEWGLGLCPQLFIEAGTWPEIRDASGIV